MPDAPDDPSDGERPAVDAAASRPHASPAARGAAAAVIAAWCALFHRGRPAQTPLPGRFAPPFFLRPFFLSHFLGVLNDLLFLVGLGSVVTFQSTLFGADPARDVPFIAAALFVLPFLLLSATAAQLACKYDQARSIRAVFTFGIVIMVVASAGVLMHDARVLYLSILLLGIRAALYYPLRQSGRQGPASRPRHPDDGPRRDRRVRVGTYGAVMLGTVSGGMAAANVAGGMMVAVLCLSVGLAGRVATAAIGPSRSVDPERRIGWNPLATTWRMLRGDGGIGGIGGDLSGTLGLLGVGWLWFIGALLSMACFGLGRETLHAGPAVVALMLAVFVAGLGVGMCAGTRFAARRPGLRLTPMGGLGVSLFALDLYLASRGVPGVPPSLETGALYDLLPFLHQAAHWRVLIDLFLLAAAAGIYGVPLHALVRYRGPLHRSAQTAVATPVVNAAFVMAAALIALALGASGVSLPVLFLVIAVANMAVIAGLCARIPGMLTTVRGPVRRVR